MKRFRLVGLLIVFLVCLQFSITAGAASKYVSCEPIDYPVKAGGATFVSKQYQVGNRYYCKIIMTKNGKSTTIAKKTDAAFVTNGTTIYYSKRGKEVNDYEYRNTIYKYNIKTKKKEKIVSGTDYMAVGCSGKYLYYGRLVAAEGVRLYSMNLKTKKKVHMYDYAGKVYISGKRVVVSTNSGDAGNYPIYSYKLNGSGKKKIADGGLLKVKSGKVYYLKVRYKDWKLKVYCCSATGKNKKALTKWVNEIPKKYYVY